MRTRSLVGRNVPSIGLGDVSLARASARGRDTGEAVRRVHDAIDAAVDVIDVAAEADAERVVGDAVRTLRARDRVIVATRVPDMSGPGGHREFAAHVRACVDASLRATKLDALPLAQLPLRMAWLANAAWPEMRGALDRLVRDGKVLAWGAIGDEPALADEAWLASIAIEFSACSRAAAPVLVAALAPPPVPKSPPSTLDAEVASALIASGTYDPAAAAMLANAPLVGVALIGAPRTAAPEVAPPPAPIVRPTILARRPLAGGALAGTLGPGVRLAPNDDRRALDPAQLEAIAVGVAKLAVRVKRLPPAATSCEAAQVIIETTQRPANVLCMTVAELALRYVIDRGAIALPRIHARADLDELVACAAAPPLPPELMARIDELWPDPAA
jgi:aryl-alcohol dehydrogenase-like predicted oxidoreductase